MKNFREQLEQAAFEEGIEIGKSIVQSMELETEEEKKAAVLAIAQRCELPELRCRVLVRALRNRRKV